MRDPLFQPITINDLQLKNRIAVPAMHLNMAEDFQVSEPMLAFYRERAKGGPGLICAGFATVDERSGSSLNIGAHRDDLVDGLSRLAETIGRGGAASCLQLNHAGRYNFSFFMDGRQPVAPSAVPSRLTRETPRALEVPEIAEIVASFARAAGRVKQAGFDAVEILCGTGYLISEFLSPLTNQRQDEYGGSPENRRRFAVEVIQAVRAEVGGSFPIIARMNGNDLMQGGLGREELVQLARNLTESGGVDCLCINVGWHEAKVPQITPSVPRAGFAYLARGIKEQVNVPVMASHRINDPGRARELIADGLCDLVAMGRAVIADPQLPEKARQDREKEIVHCIGCGQGCFDNLFQLKSVECLANPRAGHELEAGPETADHPLTVLVIGGGPAGMTAAVTAHDRGHRVLLWERQDRLGGQLHLAGSPPGREEFAVLAADLVEQVRLRDIEVRTGWEPTVESVVQAAPDRVVLATGGSPIRLNIPGVEQEHVCQAWEVLDRSCWPGRRVAIIGGGAVGVETALFLAEKGTLSGQELKFLLSHAVESCEHLASLCLSGTKEVVLIEMLDSIGQDIGKSSKWSMLQDLKRFGVQVMTGSQAKEITSSGVRITAGGQETEVAADTVVLAAGTRPVNPLQEELEAGGIDCRVVGDASAVGTAFQAIHAGYRVGMEV
jgi:2,4-dienoyl-CoA reductase (NADPH2)